MDILDIIRQYDLAKTNAQRLALDAEKNVKFELNGDTCGVFTGRDGKMRWQDFENPSRRGDAIELIRILEGCSFKEALRILDVAMIPHRPSFEVSKQAPVIREPDEIDRRNVAAVKAEMTRGKHLRNSLAARGIEIDDLPDDLIQRLGFITSCTLISTSKGTPYKVGGIVFDYGDSCKIRRVSVLNGTYSFTPSWGGKNISVGPNRLFNPEALMGCTGPVFITEGELDALTVISNGYRAVSIPGVMNYRLLLDKLTADGLKPALIIAVDTDPAGQRCCKNLEGGLRQLGISYILMNGYDGCKDLNEWFMKDPYECACGMAKAARIALKQMKHNQ